MFLPPNQQQMLMQQMFRSPDGTSFSPPQGQGGIGNNGNGGSINIAPSFDAPMLPQGVGPGSNFQPMPPPGGPGSPGGPGPFMPPRVPDLPSPGGPGRPGPYDPNMPGPPMPASFDGQGGAPGAARYLDRINSEGQNVMPQDTIPPGEMDEGRRQRLIEAIMGAAKRLGA